MPLTVTTTSVLVCDTCGRSAAHTAGTNSPLFEDWAEAHRWLIVEAVEPGGRSATICPLCRPVLRAVEQEIERRLDGRTTTDDSNVVFLPPPAAG